MSSDLSSEEERLPKRRKMSPSRSGLGGNGGRQKPGAQNGSAPSGFAAKMMAKMGYVAGQGLGAEGKGRLNPIETQLRPQGAGLGVVKEKTKQAKEEEKREAAFRGEVLEDSSEEERKRRKRTKAKSTPGSATPDGRSAQARSKPKFRTVKEIETAAEGLKVPAVLHSIIDATGSETKTLNSAAGLMSQTLYVPSETEEVKIAKRAQRDLMSFSDEWIALKRREEYFEADNLELVESAAADGEAFDADRLMLDLVRDLQKMPISNRSQPSEPQVWEETVKKLAPLGLLHAQDKQVAAERQELAVAAVHPIFKTAMSDWEPLQDPKGIATNLEQLSDIFGIKQPSSDTALIRHGDISTSSIRRSTSPYETMIYTLWLPTVRNCIMRDWNVKDSAPMIAVLEAWTPILPQFVLANLVDQLVVQRLIESLAAWNPAKGKRKNSHSMGPHAWLFPWLPYLDQQHTDPKNSSGLLAEVKRKFKSLLVSWNLSQGVIPGLDQWKSVLSSDLSDMLIRYLLPRFRPHMASFEVNPRDQQMDHLENVLDWSRYFSVSSIAEFLRTEFFPKWHDSLYIWLTTPSVNYDEVGQWYQWWKSVFDESVSPDFSSQPPASKEWQKGLQLMLQASEIGPAATAKLPRPKSAIEPKSSEKHQAHTKPIPPEAEPRIPHEAVATFKDVVEEWCQENDLFLKPLREADVQTGLPLFRITASATGRGGVVVYLKGDIVWVRKVTSAGMESAFLPMALDENLAKQAESR